jgi:class 3 adenylate cyclase
LQAGRKEAAIVRREPVRAKSSGVEIPETRYAKSGDVHVAYKLWGHGRFDVVHVVGLEYPTIEGMEIPPLDEEARAALECAAPLMRRIRFDKRGTGASDRAVGVPSLEERMDDLRAVMDAAGSQTAALFGEVDGAAMSLLFAATYPERTFGLVLWHPKPRFVRAPDYPWAPTRDGYERETAESVEAWINQGSIAVVRQRLEAFFGGPPPEDRVRGWALRTRLTVSPGAWVALRRMNMEVDVRQILPAIHVPTLLIHRVADQFDPSDTTSAEIVQYMAERMPNARTLEVPRDAYQLGVLVSDEVIGFLDDAWERWTHRAAEPGRVLATVLFTDLVASTAKAVEAGPRWGKLLHEHNAVVRHQLALYNGKEIDNAGDGFFASGFDGPARAIRCGCAIRDSVTSLGLGVRVGVHTGECELVDGKLSGLAVNIGSRVVAQAEEGEVLVSGTVRDLVAGSGIEFEPHGVRQLKGLGEWPLFAVVSA